MIEKSHWGNSWLFKVYLAHVHAWQCAKFITWNSTSNIWEVKQHLNTNEIKISRNIKNNNGSVQNLMVRDEIQFIIQTAVHTASAVSNTTNTALVTLKRGHEKRLLGSAAWIHATLWRLIIWVRLTLGRDLLLLINYRGIIREVISGKFVWHDFKTASEGSAVKICW